MNWDRIEGNWKDLSGYVKAQWDKLTDDDIKKIGGKRAQLETRIASRYGYEKEQVSKDIDRWLAETEFEEAPPPDSGPRNADRAAFEHGDKG